MGRSAGGWRLAGASRQRATPISWSSAVVRCRLNLFMIPVAEKPESRLSIAVARRVARDRIRDAQRRVGARCDDCAPGRRHRGEHRQPHQVGRERAGFAQQHVRHGHGWPAVPAAAFAASGDFQCGGRSHAVRRAPDDLRIRLASPRRRCKNSISRAAKQNGLSFETVSGALAKMSKNIPEGGKGPAGAISDLGLSVKRLEGHGAGPGSASYRREDAPASKTRCSGRTRGDEHLGRKPARKACPC